MRSTILLGLICVLFPLAKHTSAQTPVPPQKEHQWLQQFVGEWVTESEGSMGPDQPPVKCEGTMSAHMLGEFWVVNKIQGDLMGTQMHGLQTIGFDTKTQKYVGTWVDSMMGHMWKYQGEVDASGKILTLEAEGPNFMEEGKTSLYHDIYEFKSPDHIVLTSAIKSEDGKWLTIMKGDMRRK